MSTMDLTPTAAGSKIDLISQLHTDTEAIGETTKRPTAGRQIASLVDSSHLVPLGDVAIDTIIDHTLRVREYEVTGAHNPHRSFPSARSVGATEALRVDEHGAAAWFDVGRRAWRAGPQAGPSSRASGIGLVADPVSIPEAYGPLRFALAALELGHASWMFALFASLEGFAESGRIRFGQPEISVPASLVLGPTWSPGSTPDGLVAIDGKTETSFACHIESAARNGGASVPLSAIVDGVDTPRFAAAATKINSGRCYKGLTPIAPSLSLDQAQVDVDMAGRQAFEFALPAPLQTVAIVGTAKGRAVLGPADGAIDVDELPVPDDDEVQAFCNAAPSALRADRLEGVVLHLVPRSATEDPAAIKRALLEAGARTQRLGLHVAADRSGFCRPIKSYAPDRLGDFGRALGLSTDRYVAYAAIVGRSAFEDLRMRFPAIINSRRPPSATDTTRGTRP